MLGEEDESEEPFQDDSDESLEHFDEDISLSEESLDESLDLDETLEELEKDLELDEVSEEKDEEKKDKLEQPQEEGLEEDEGLLDETLAELERDLELDLDEGIEEKKEEEEKIPMEEGIERDIEESLEKANSILSDLHGRSVPREFLEALIEESELLAESSRYTEAVDRAQEALDFGKELEKFGSELDRLKEKIEKLKKEGLDIDVFEERVDDAREEIKRGEVEEAFSILEDTFERIEKRRKKGKKDIKEKINQTIKEIGEMLDVAKKFDIPLLQVRDIISTALELSKEGYVDQALENLQKAKKRSYDILRGKIENELSELENKRGSIFDDKKRDRITECIQRADRAKERGDFKEAHRSIVEGKKEAEKSGLKVGSTKVDDIIRIKELSETIGIDCSEAEGYIESAKQAHKEGRKRKSERDLKKAKEVLLKKVSKELQRVMKEGMKKLEKAKKRGEEISKPVSHLKQANLMIKKKEFVKALEHAKEFTEEIKEMSEEKEVLTTTVEKVDTTSAKKVKKVSGTEKTRENSKSSSSSTSSPPKGDRKDKRPHFGVDDFYKGSTNLLKIETLPPAYSLFKKLIKKTKRGVCVTREYPEKVKKKYGLKEIQNRGGQVLSLIWLSNIDREESVKPKDLEGMSLRLESFISDGEGVILLNGLEYLVSNNSFKTVFHLIQSLKDQVAVGQSILLITVSPDTFTKSQMNQLEREVDEIFP
ncbi:MAG: DUF835 domain-containing protein [Candidatus Natronoplasma sp.]